jgi:hypothetical protein
MTAKIFKEGTFTQKKYKHCHSVVKLLISYRPQSNFRGTICLFDSDFLLILCVFFKSILTNKN